MVGDLVAKVRAEISGTFASNPNTDEDAETALFGALSTRSRHRSDDSGPSGALLIEGNGHHLRLSGPDRPGLFAAAVGVLSLHGQDVRAARARSLESGMVVDEFVIEPIIKAPDWSQFRSDLERALAGRMALEARLAERARRYQPRRSAARPAEPLVIIDNAQSSKATVIEVRAPDGVGVLFRIGRVLADLRLDIRHAKVSTIGHEVIDTFYVLDLEGSKITDRTVLEEIELAIVFALHQVWLVPAGVRGTP